MGSMQYSYTVKCKFSTAKASSRAGQVTGSHGGGEVDITSESPLDKNNLTEPELVEGCTSVLQANPKCKKMGKIISLEIIEIVENDKTQWPFMSKAESDALQERKDKFNQAHWNFK